MDRLKDKVAIVTGGASGIGEAIARRYVQEGARVVVADRQDAAGARLASELGPSARYQPTDVARASEAEAMVRSTLDWAGRLDILVNNAGIIVKPASILEHSEADFDRLIAVNLKGVWLCTRAAFPALEKAAGAAVINIGSIAAVIGNPDQTAYGASKGGVVQLTRHCAAEGAGKRIRVNSISPGGIVTGMSRSLRPDRTQEQESADNAARNPLRRAGLPDDIAWCAVWLGSDEAGYVTGQNIVIDGGVTSLKQPIHPPGPPTSPLRASSAARDRPS